MRHLPSHRRVRILSCSPDPPPIPEPAPRVFTPNRLDRALTQQQPDGAPPVSFLDRAQAERSAEEETRRRAALGAYLAARLVERLLALDGTESAEEGLRWQQQSTLHYVRDLPRDDAESAYLAAIVTAVQPGPGRRLPTVRITLRDYASFLEYEARFGEALDALRLSAATWLGEIPGPDFADLALFAGRLNRQIGRHELAEDCFASVEEAVAGSGDVAPALRARLGRAGILRDCGRLVDARAEVERVIAETEGQQHLGAVAGLAYADLGAVLARSGRPVEAVRALYDAFRRTPDPIQRLRILGELGAGLAELGAVDAARIAFELVADSRTGVLVRAGAHVHLMDLASGEGDRIGFERNRTAVGDVAGNMPPQVAVDFGFRSALGFARFGQFSRATEIWRETRALADRHGDADTASAIAQVLAGLDGCRRHGVARQERVEAPPEIAALAADLRVLATHAGA